MYTPAMWSFLAKKVGYRTHCWDTQNCKAFEVRRNDAVPNDLWEQTKMCHNWTDDPASEAP